MKIFALLLPIWMVIACERRGDETTSRASEAPMGSVDAVASSPPAVARVAGKRQDPNADHCCKCNNGCQTSLGGPELAAACLAWCTSRGDPGQSVSEGRCKVERC